MRIGFWRTQKNRFFCSHQKGLVLEQIQQLQALKVGDRLCLWMNEDKDGNSPDFVIKKLEEMK